jgi:hypothetical protein
MMATVRILDFNMIALLVLEVTNDPVWKENDGARLVLPAGAEFI